MTSQLLEQLLEDVQIEDNHPGKEIINVDPDLEIKEIHRREKIWMVIIIVVKIIIVNLRLRWCQTKRRVVQVLDHWDKFNVVIQLRLHGIIINVEVIGNVQF